MAQSPADDNKQNQEKPKSSQKRAAIIVGLVCVVVVGAILALNSDRLSVNSDVSTPPVDEEQEPADEPAPNTPPEIVNVIPATDRIAPFDLCEVTCEAIDADGDTLTYSWDTAQGDVYGEGSTIEWGAPDSEGLFRLSVTVDDGRGGIADYSVSLRVKANTLPQILTMSSSTDWLTPGESLVVSVTTEDADGDDLSYTWSASGGEFIGEGTSVLWIAPAEVNSYWITLDVDDGYGGKARRAIPISVTEGEPPTLGEFVLEGVDTDLLKPTEDAWKIFRGRTCRIECVVVDGDGPFEYEWSAEKGTLHPDGNTVVWDAPDGREQVYIVVKVTDKRGNSSSASVLIYVETCTCAFK